jgi:hypothetical protein
MEIRHGLISADSRCHRAQRFSRPHVEKQVGERIPQTKEVKVGRQSRTLVRPAPAAHGRGVVNCPVVMGDQPQSHPRLEEGRLGPGPQ